MKQPYADLAEMEAWAEALIASRDPDIIIGDNYLRRWWVIPRNEYCNVYLHEINRSDDTRALHDHPWPNSSFIIRGNYLEHTPDAVIVRSPGDYVKRPATAKHRLEVIDDSRVLTLFMTGPRVREWGFDCPGGWIPWQQFDVEGCGE